MTQLFSNIRIVLVNTSHPGNIGAAARAMKTMGLTRLYLVDPQQYPCAEATARASGADDVLAAARVCDTLEEAVAECGLVVATSARERRLEYPSLSPDECALKLLSEASGNEVALVFGRERTGLTNEELDHCHYLTNIPSNPEYSSLNLAAAIQVLCYELRKASIRDDIPVAPEPDTAERFATAMEMEGLHRHLADVMQQVNLVSPDKPKLMLHRRLRRLFQRARPSVTEVNILRGILSAVQGKKLPKPDQLK